MRVSPFLGDRRGAHQLWVDAGIDFSGRIDQLFALVLVNNGGGDRLAVAIFEDELRLKIEVARLRRGGRKDEGEGRKDSE